MQEILFVNLTPHTVNVLIGEDEVVFEPSGEIARVETFTEPASEEDGIPVFFSGFGRVLGLPEQADNGIRYIVSGMVLARVQHRTDVFAPGTLVRDIDGRVIGCRGLSCTEAFRKANVPF